MKSKDTAYQHYQNQRIAHWENVASQLVHKYKAGKYYQDQLAHHFRLLIPPNRNIIEVGCGQGDLLAGLKPVFGVGVDFSGKMLQLASERHPTLHFVQADAHNIPLEKKFDFIIFSDLVNDLWDVQAMFENLYPLTNPKTRLILNTYSLVWEPILKLAQRMGLGKPNLEQNWLTVEDIQNLLYLTSFELITRHEQILLPFPIPFISKFTNRVLVKLWPFYYAALTNIIIARPKTQVKELNKHPKVSVIIPARNESGNIPHILERVPTMGCETELVFIEGQSTDDTYEIIEKAIAHHKEHHCQLLKQTGKGKGDAVRLGFEKSTGNILMILDADMTVPPEDLPRFYQALINNHGEFINGVRLVYPVENQAMRFLNMIGNKFFSLAFSWLLGQPIKDTLCGTKVFWKSDYQLIAANRDYFGDFDPFGDFDLLFGAAKLNLKIIDLPIRYRNRSFGTTNIDRWRHGWLLLKMVNFAAKRIKFV